MDHEGLSYLFERHIANWRASRGALYRGALTDNNIALRNRLTSQ
jgi:hypothetical protein